ncbi:MAG: hypothetical protein PHP25_01320 [Candidatus Moranbacteria bacterium]|nr:hypothetical protein [Candidatus Moranbacteria bacterium]
MIQKNIVPEQEPEESQLAKIEKFVRWEAASRDIIDFKCIYVDVAGDLVSGLLLSQIVFWHLPDRYGKTKLRAKNRKKELCLAKNRSDWLEECRIKCRPYDLAIKKLEKKGIVSVTNSLFRNKRTPFIKLNYDVLLDLIDKADRENRMRGLPSGE